MRIVKITIPALVVVLTSILVAPLAAWGLAQGYPDIYMQTSPATKDVPVGGSGAFTVSIISQEGFEGKVQLTAENVPAGVTVTFDPNPIDIPAYSQGDAKMTVSTTPEVPAGSITLTVVGTSKDQFMLEAGLNYVKESIPVTINIVSGAAQQQQQQPPAQQQQQQPIQEPPAEQSPGDALTSTVTSTTTTVTTITATVTEVITTRTSAINTKTVLAGFGQPSDLTLPTTALVTVVALLAVAAITLRPRAERKIQGSA